ncbi:MAG: peptide-methionine (S)-S-oxide reductase MsrA [Chitinophagaceae bacterium]|nr:peptide-methionine (S)-S-oxide reductase MsrA [Chitinophagaceae bacterium]
MSNTTQTIISAALLGMVSMLSCNTSSGNQSLKKEIAAGDSSNQQNTAADKDSASVIYFAGGCFWGTEHFFKQIKGVIATEVGFANGHTEHPTYEDVVQKNTGFAETVKVTYNPQTIDLDLLLNLFFLTIDPTSVNRQGNDIGDQYRTGIYYTSDQQLSAIRERINAETAMHHKPIVVEVGPLENYYKAEDYHQDYLEHNPGGYCHINPALFKVAKDANQKK